jgi:hypothetical protein
MAMILALVPSLPLLTFWAWFTWELPPLERYYLVAYWDSTEGAKRPGAQTQIQWLSETAPERKSQWIIGSDVTEGSQNGLPLELSSAALGQGWIGIEKSPVQSIGSAELEGFLREDFYDGRSLRQMVTEPLLYSCTTLLVVLYLVLVMRDAIRDEWRRLRRAVAEPEWIGDFGGDWTVNQESIFTQFGSDIAQWTSKTRSLFNSVDFKAVISRRGSVDQPPSVESFRDGNGPVSTEVKQEISSSQQLANPLSPPSSKALSKVMLSSPDRLCRVLLIRSQNRGTSPSGLTDANDFPSLGFFQVGTHRNHRRPSQ